MDWVPMWLIDFLTLLQPIGEPLFIAFVGGSLAGWLVGYKTARVLSEHYIQTLHPIVAVSGQGNSPTVEVIGKDTPQSFVFNGDFHVGSESKPAKPISHSFNLTCTVHKDIFQSDWVSFDFDPGEFLSPGGRIPFENLIERGVHNKTGCNLVFTARVRYTDFQELGFYEQTGGDRFKILRKDPRKKSLFKRLWEYAGKARKKLDRG